MNAPAGKRFDLSSLLGYRLQRLSGSFAALTQREVEDMGGVSLPEYRILAILHSTGPAGVVALQQALFIDKAWISRTVSKLADRKLVTPIADPGDARRTLWRVTSEGARIARMLTERSVLRQARILKGLTDSEIKQFFDLIARVQESVDKATSKITG